MQGSAGGFGHPLLPGGGGAGAAAPREPPAPAPEPPRRPPRGRPGAAGRWVPGLGKGRGHPTVTPVPKLCPPPPPKGAVCDFRLSYGRLFGRQTVVVAVNRDRAQLLRNADVFWRPRLAVQGDSPGPPAAPMAPARWWHRGRWGRGRVRWFWGTIGIWGELSSVWGQERWGLGPVQPRLGLS